jgi:MATE family multidrug resistance protein
MSLPVIFTLLSGTLMYNVDRILLAHYSLAAMNGATFVHQMIDVIVLPLLSITAISEVFVGQFNGAQKFYKTSAPIMQIAAAMIIGWAIVYPIALCFRSSFIPQSLLSEGDPYFCISLVMIPFQILNCAFSAFFVGTRRPNVTLSAVLMSNVLNFGLDFLLIFGAAPFPAMGTKGAAIASLVATITSATILGMRFFSDHNAQNYNTRRMCVDWVILRKNLIIGAPYAVSELVEMLIWVAVLILLEKISMDAVTLQNVGVTFWVFFAFISEGCQKGVMSLASNCIGAGRDIFIRRLVRSMLWIIAFWAVISAIPMLVYPKQLLAFTFDITNVDKMTDYKILLFLIWLSYLFVLWASSCFGGILSSGGDTKFVTCVRIASILLWIAIPVGTYAYLGKLTALTSWWLGVLQQIFNGIFFYRRYRSGKWKHSLVRE